jgi:hypothetical protein
MAVTYDNDAENSGTVTTAVTVAGFAVGSNSDRYLIVAVGAWDATAGDAVVSGVTFNGSSTGWGLIQSEQGPSSVGSNNRITLWGLKNPTATTADVVVTMAGTCAEVGVHVLSVYNVDQTTPLGTPATAEGDADTVATVDVSAATDDLVYDAVFGNVNPAAGSTAGGSQTERSEVFPVSGTLLHTSTAPGATTTTMSWTADGEWLEWVQLGVALKAAGGEEPPITDGPALVSVRSNIRFN